MSTYMKDLNGQLISAFKVTAYDEKDELVAEFIFDSLKEATKFELGMREKEYTTKIERVNV